MNSDQRTDRIKQEFSRKICGLSNSPAYLDACEEVCGYRLPLFNMMDKEQIDYLLNAVPISSRDTVLDLGCGDGSLLRLIAAKYGCNSIGIDLLDSGLVSFGKEIQYICGDAEYLRDYGLLPTVTISIDSMYFCASIDKIIEQLDNRAGNRLYFYWSQYLLDEAADRDCLKSDFTALACTLQKAGITYRSVDFSKNEYRLYIALEQALRSRRHAFETEGHLDLYKQKLDETLYGIELYEKKMASRHLYIANQLTPIK